MNVVIGRWYWIEWSGELEKVKCLAIAGDMFIARYDGCVEITVPISRAVSEVAPSYWYRWWKPWTWHMREQQSCES